MSTIKHCTRLPRDIKNLFGHGPEKLAEANPALSMEVGLGDLPRHLPSSTIL